jgi:hypothetical protein
MATVEELAHKLGYYIEGDDIGSGNDLLNELLDTAKKEYERGRAEGAEQMREKIVAESYPCRLSEKSHCWIFRIDDPTLSPAPKEKP